MRTFKITVLLGLFVSIAILISIFQSGPAGYPFNQKATVWYLSLPNFVFEWQLEGDAEIIDNQTLHPKMQYLFEKSRSPESNAKYEAMLKTPEGRALYRDAVDKHWPLRTIVSKPMAQQEDIVIPSASGDIKARVYRPHHNQPDPLPVLLYFHGGAYLFGSYHAVDL